MEIVIISPKKGFVRMTQLSFQHVYRDILFTPLMEYVQINQENKILKHIRFITFRVIIQLYYNESIK